MKHLIFSLILLPALLAFSGEISESPIAIVQKVVGKVDYKKQDAEWQAAKKGITLNDEDMLRTSRHSLSVVSFIDGSVLRVRENSELIVYGRMNNKKINKSVEIKNGKFGFEVRPQNNEEFRFITPSVVASIKGTDGFIEVKEDSSTVIFLNSGSMELESVKGAKVRGMLQAGNSALVSPEGEIMMRESNDDDLRQFNKIINMKTKTILIKTSSGVIEIEYLDDSEQ